MEDGYNFRQLQAAILALSLAKEWEVAKPEWGLVEIYDADEPQTCLCGHPKIIEICVIKNRINQNTAEIGNVCIHRFLGIRSDLIFEALKRIRADSNKSLNGDAIVYFKDKGLLNDWEYRFCESTIRRRHLSSAQMDSRQKINAKVLAAVKRRGFLGPS